ncbi:transcriptional regulator [Streptomyces roseoverticillatus]|uniref:transcriptional regulator n=1 Tax=Streptomyces roseoverticillatus TaxID=66429 RepID=UPI0033D12E0A
MSAAVFAAVFIALYIGHSVGDHWVQTSHQSATKGKPGWAGRLADTRHVATLTATKLAVLLLATTVLDLDITVPGLVAGLGADALTHWWADRRSTLAWLARVTGQSEFYSLGSSAHPVHPVTAEGRPAGHLGTGAYALDQSFHHLWLLVAALIIATV